MVHIEGNKILISKEEVGIILTQFQSNKPTIILTDERTSRAYTIDLLNHWVGKEKNEILIKEL